MASWDVLLPGLAREPVAGEPADYYAAAAHTRGVARATADVHDHVAQLGIALGELRGATADAFVARVGRLAAAIATAAPYMVAAAERFARHADRLGDLLDAGALALARAAERHDRLRAAEQQRESASRALAATDAQLAALRFQPGADAAIAALERRRWSQLGTVRWWQAQVAQRAAELDASRAEHAALGEQERVLRAATAAGLLAEPLPALPTIPGHVAHGSDFGAWVTVASAVMEAQFAQLAVAVIARLTPLPGVVTDALVEHFVDEFATLVPSQQFAALTALAEFYRRLTTGAPRPGDLGDTYAAEHVSVWATAHTVGRGGTPSLATLGGGAVIEALRITASAHLLGPDEFAVAEIAGGRYVVVLPGVTDLTSPDYGFSDEHRTARDLDRFAVPSSTSTGVADNGYARLVAGALHEFGVPPGSRVMLVGHSFGADTAVDLAADPQFNGPAGFEVTHVVAAGYFSDPQLPHVRADTNVLVLQNARDLPVNLERAGYHPVGALDHAVDAVAELASGDAVGGLAELVGAAGDVVAALGSAGPIPPLVPVPGLPPFGGQLAPRLGVSTPRPNQLLAVFAGGAAGWGHDQQNYIDYLADHEVPEVDAFTASIATAGYAGPGAVYALDVSVPSARPRRLR